MMMFNNDALQKIQEGICPYCGRSGFHFTISHIVQKHQISVDEVREEFGINYHEPLCTPQFSTSAGNRPQCHTEEMLSNLKFYRENQPKTRRGYALQGRENHLNWLLSQRHIDIFRRVIHSPDAIKKLKISMREVYKKRKILPNGRFS